MADFEHVGPCDHSLKRRVLDTADTEWNVFVLRIDTAIAAIRGLSFFLLRVCSQTCWFYNPVVTLMRYAAHGEPAHT